MQNHAKYETLEENIMTSSGNHPLRHETAIETAKAIPALFGAGFSAVTLNEAVAVVTLIYILLQVAYLIWKWRREARKA